MLAIFVAGIWVILAAGSKLNSTQNGAAPASVSSSPETKSGATSTQTQINKLFRPEDRSPLSILLLQIIVIIVVAKLFAAIFRRIGQPPVMGEKFAGIALGPSVLGFIARIFHHSSSQRRWARSVLSQIRSCSSCSLSEWKSI